jgi:hypothetical protein
MDIAINAGSRKLTSMRWGLDKVVKVTFAMLTLACVLLTVFTSPCITNANARADFATWANRSTRSLEPADYNTNGTSTCQICNWKGTQGIGNVGIGDGSISALTNGTTKEETLYPDYDLQGVVTTEGSQYPGVNRTEMDAGNTSVVGSGLKIGGTPDIITYGKPYPGILNEYPAEATAVYGKLTGLKMPDGRSVEIGVKSIGYEY